MLKLKLQYFGHLRQTLENSLMLGKAETLLTNVLTVKAMIFPVVTYSYESRTIKKAEHQGTDALEL